MPTILLSEVIRDTVDIFRRYYIDDFYGLMSVLQALYEKIPGANLGMTNLRKELYLIISTASDPQACNVKAYRVQCGVT